MKSFLAFLVIVCSTDIVCFAQTIAPLRSLTPRNFFVYEYNRGRRSYDQVLRDTVINTQRYGVVYNSYTASLRFERSDANNIYEWRNGKDIATYSLNWRIGDTVQFKFFWHGCDTCRYIIAKSDKQYDSFFSDTVFTYSLKFVIPPMYGFYPYEITLLRNYGVQAIDTNRIVYSGGLPMRVENVGATSLVGASADGRIIGDTSGFVSVKGSEPIAGFNHIPNPFSESVSLTYSLGTAAQDVELRITAITGETLAIIKKGVQAAGRHDIEWNGKSADGREAPQGSYIASLFVNGRKQQDVKVVKVR